MKFWPISDEPTTLPFTLTSEPFARFDIVNCEMPVTTSGYTNPSSTVSTTVMSKPVSELATQHQCTPSAVTMMSMSLIPMNGAMIPPTP